MSDSPHPWQDQDPVDPAWSAPVATQPESGLAPSEPDPTPPDPDPTPPDPDPTLPEPVKGRSPSKLLTVGIPILAVVLIIGLVWGLGGFKQRKDQLIDKDPGTVLATGPYEFTFTTATAQRKEDYDGTHYWEVIVIGTGRTTGDASISPDYLGNDAMFVTRDLDTPEVQLPESSRIGTGDASVSASNFTPGLPATSYKVTFRFSDKYKPDKTIRFGVFQLVFSNELLTGAGEKTWNTTPRAFHLHLPVETLPEQEF